MGLPLSLNFEQLASLAPTEIHLLDLQAIPLTTPLPIPETPSSCSFEQSPLSQLALDKSLF